MSELSFEEALELLGIGPEAGPDGARRAYLRRLKRCKPERDPEGFMRLRRAYELVRDQIAWYAPVDDAWEDQPGPADDPPEPDAVGEPPEPPSAPMVELVPPVDVDLDSHYKRMEEAREEGSPEARLAIAREAVQEHPDHTTANWMLVYELQDAGRTEELTAALREAHRRGLPGFLSMLVSSSPESLTEDEIAEIRGGDELELRVSLATALVRRGEVQQGVELANAVIAEVEGAEETHPALGIYPELLDLILDLHQRDHTESAAALTRCIDRSLQVTGEGLRFATYVNVAKWILIQELAEVSGTLDPPLRRGLVEAIREGDLEGESLQKLRSFTRWHGSRVSRVSATISPDAPNLGEMLNSVIDEVARRRQRNRPASGVNPSVWIAIVAAIFASNALFRMWDSGRDSDTLEQLITPEISEKLRETASRLHDKDAGLFAARLEALCRWARTDAGARGSSICGAAEALRSEDRTRICPALAALHDAIRRIETWPRLMEMYDVPWHTLQTPLDFLPQVEQEQQRQKCVRPTAASDAAPAGERRSD